MEKQPPEGTIERQVGFLAGRIDGLTDAVKALSGRFDEHLKEHRATWLWIVPTVISLATLIVLIIALWGDRG
jgi:hypothetical protein